MKCQWQCVIHINEWTDPVATDCLKWEKLINGNTGVEHEKMIGARYFLFEF